MRFVLRPWGLRSRCESCFDIGPHDSAEWLAGKLRGREFRNGIVPEWEWLLVWAWLRILFNLRGDVVLYWELLDWA
jgi:hypothetical protein